MNIRYLDLSCNQITRIVSIPCTLESLIITENQLISIPKLKHLKEFRHDKNYL